MQLFYHPLSTYSQKVLIAFHEKGVPFEPVVVNMMDPAARADYETINPLGKIPFLKPRPDYSVPESTSIIEYLEDTQPGTPRLIPAEGGEAARIVRFLDRVGDLYLNEPVSQLLFMQLGWRPHDEAAAAKARRYASLTLAHYEQRLAQYPWLGGEAFSMADCAALPALFYAREAFPFEDRPLLVAYYQRASARPAVARVQADAQAIFDGIKAARAQA